MTMMQKYNPRCGSKRTHVALEPNLLVINTLRGRVRALGEMILEITDAALSEAEVLSREIASSGNGSSYMPLNNRICRNVLNTVVRSNRECGKIVVAVSIVNTRDSNYLPSECKRSVEPSSGRSPITQPKRKLITNLRSGVSQTSESRESSSVASRQTSRVNDRPWRQKPLPLRSIRSTVNENESNSMPKGSLKIQCEVSASESKKRVMWDDDVIEQFLKDKPTAGNYKELIRPNEASKAKRTPPANEGTPKPTNSSNEVNQNGDDSEFVSIQSRAPLYDKSYDFYVDSTQTLTHDVSNDEQSTIFYSCGFSSIEAQKKGSRGGKHQNGTAGKHLLSENPAETLSGVYHLPGAILKQETIPNEEMVGLLSKSTRMDGGSALVFVPDLHSRTTSSGFHPDSSIPISPNPRKPHEGAQIRAVHFDYVSNSHSATTPPIPFPSFARECSPQSLRILPVLPGEPCCVQLRSTPNKNTSDPIKECM